MRALIATASHLKSASGGFCRRHGDGSKNWRKQCNWRRAAVSTTGRTTTESRLFRTARIPARRRCIVLTPRRKVRARTSCVFSNCWPVCRLVETTWWQRSSRACRSGTGSKSRVSWKFHRCGQPGGGEDWRSGEAQGDRVDTPSRRRAMFTWASNRRSGQLCTASLWR